MAAALPTRPSLPGAVSVANINQNIIPAPPYAYVFPKSTDQTISDTVTIQLLTQTELNNKNLNLLTSMKGRIGIYVCSQKIDDESILLQKFQFSSELVNEIEERTKVDEANTKEDNLQSKHKKIIFNGVPTQTEYVYAESPIIESLSPSQIVKLERLMDRLITTAQKEYDDLQAQNEFLKADRTLMHGANSAVMTGSGSECICVIL